MKKCIENERIHKLVDEEISEAEKVRLENHLAVCSECRLLLDSVRQTRLLLIAQPPILPDRRFDNEMLRLIEKKTGKNEAQKNILSIFSSFSLKLGFASLIIAAALGLAFQLGRMSASSLPQIILTQDLSAQKDSNPATPTEKTIVSKPTEKIVTQFKTVTRFVQVPVIRKIREEKIVYAKSQRRENSETPVTPEPENVAKNFNLNDLQPVSEISYRVVRRGENNE